MTYLPSEIVTPPARLPVSATDDALAAAVVEEVERLILQRAIVHQVRRVVIDGTLPILELEPVSSIVSITRWTPTDPADVIDPASYDVVTRDPAGALIAPSTGYDWPAPERRIGSFVLTYEAGWEVTDTTNLVPASIQHMLNRAVEFRAGAGLGTITPSARWRWTRPTRTLPMRSPARLPASAAPGPTDRGCS